MGPTRSLVACCFLAVAATAFGQTSRLAPLVTRQIEEAGESEVLVVFSAPPVPHADMTERRRIVGKGREALLSRLAAPAVRVRHPFAVLTGFTATVTAQGVRQLLAQPGVLRVEPMLRGGAALAQSVPQIRADAVHRREDMGQGVTVAILDTGIETTHPDLAGSIVAEECFCATSRCCPDGSGRQSGPGSAASSTVHGTHVAGIVVSKGIVAPVGVAPGANVVAIKVLADNNSGYLADWLAALDWIAANRPDVQAVNMSLASYDAYPGQCDQGANPNGYAMLFQQAIAPLRARGTLTFAASGNGGLRDQMTMPACVSAAVAVGAVTKQDTLSSFTNRNATLALLAPGQGIVSTGPGWSISFDSGTSMAAPHATGTAALLLAVDPTLQADVLEGVLTSTGTPIIDAASGLTFPRVNALAALTAVVNSMQPMGGGGQRRNDCLVEWTIAPPGIATALPFPSAVCRDNDPSCDTDPTPGQCTFSVAACFNVPDRWLPSCAADVPLAAYELLSPRPSPLGGAVEAANAAAIRAALPSFPVASQNVCTAPIPIVVPVGHAPGVGWIRLSATASDGRVDRNRVRLTCLPAQP